jgi:hypothetical protein
VIDTEESAAKEAFAGVLADRLRGPVIPDGSSLSTRRCSRC